VLIYACDTQIWSDAQEQWMKPIGFDDYPGSHGTTMVLAEAAAPRSEKIERNAGDFVRYNKIESGFR
jgi:hypothetical protein